MKWHDKPVTMSFTEKSVPITKIPFPAVTVCPEIKAMKFEFDVSSALKSLPNLSDTQWELFI